MLREYWSGNIIAMDMLHPTGEWSARLMIFAMMLEPAGCRCLGQSRGLTGWCSAAVLWASQPFAYAVLH